MLLNAYFPNLIATAVARYSVAGNAGNTTMSSCLLVTSGRITASALSLPASSRNACVAHSCNWGGAT